MKPVPFTRPGSQSATQIWNATENQSGAVANAGYDGAPAPNASTTFGLLGSGSAPSALIGITCTTR